MAKQPDNYHYRHSSPPTKENLDRVKRELQSHGAVAYDLWLPETRHLPSVLHDNEHIMGSVYGRYPRDQEHPAAGRGVLVATDQRVLFLDKKPMYVHCDELTFLIVGGVTYSRTVFLSSVTLHTRLGDFKLRTFNHKNAANFVDYIEAKCLQNQKGDNKYEALT